MQNCKVENELDALKQVQIEVLKTDLSNEKAIINNDLMKKEKKILQKGRTYLRLDIFVFWSKWRFILRKKAIGKANSRSSLLMRFKNIVKAKKYDFVFDKSSELIMLYSNKKYDISEIVLASIDKTRKVTDRKAKQQEKKTVPKEVSDRQKALLAAKKKKRDELLAKKEKKKQLIADRRAELLAKKEAKRKQLKEKQEAAKKKKEE